MEDSRQITYTISNGIDYETWAKLKIYCIMNRTTIKALMIGWITDFVSNLEDEQVTPQFRRTK